MSLVEDLNFATDRKLKLKQSYLLWRPLDTINITIVALLLFFAFLQIFSRPVYILAVVMLSLVFYLLIKVNRHFESTGHSSANYNWHIIYPVVLIFFILQSFYLFTPDDVNRAMDVSIYNFELRIFRTSPARMLEPFLNPILVDVAFLVYLSFFAVPIIYVLKLIYSNRRNEIRRTYFIMALTLYLVLIGNFFLPAAGPYSLLNADFDSQIYGVYLTKLVPDILKVIQHTQFNAFPSLPAAASIALLLLSFRGDRGFFFRILPLAILIQVAGIYLRYEYVSGTLAGLIVGYFAFQLGDWIYHSQYYSQVTADERSKEIL